jgi:hypothetical protein
MFWYALQTATIYWIIQVYAKLTPGIPKFDIVLFALLCAYAMTWVLSFVLDLLRRIWLLTLRLDALLSQQRSNHLRVEVTKHILPRPRPKKWVSGPTRKR